MSVHHDTAVVQSRDGWLAPSIDELQSQRQVPDGLGRGAPRHRVALGSAVSAERLADDLYVMTLPTASQRIAPEVVAQWKKEFGPQRRLVVLSEGTRLQRVSAVHDYASVTVSMLVDPDDDTSWRLQRGDRIEVVGYAYQGHHLMAIWRDDAGALHDILAGAIRMEPHVEEPPA